MWGIGFTDQIDADEVGHLDHALTASSAAVEPPTVELQWEAGYLKSHPTAALSPWRRAAHDAVPSVLGAERFTETPVDLAKFLPHVSISYITYDDDPEPIERF